jgi:tetrahydromethanopterin S-methyltransferase subunit G
MTDSDRVAELESRIDDLEKRIEELASRLAWLLEVSP